MALANDVFVYPKNDQTMEQQQKDKFECYDWAKREIGFDPQAVHRTETPPPHQSSLGPDGSIARGAARGALLGEIVSDDAGKGAATGAAKYAEKRNRYDRAYKVCLEARDYSVS